MVEGVDEDVEHGVEVGPEVGEAVPLDEDLKAADHAEGSGRRVVTVKEGSEVSPLSRGEAPPESRSSPVYPRQRPKLLRRLRVRRETSS